MQVRLVVPLPHALEQSDQADQPPSRGGPHMIADACAASMIDCVWLKNDAASLAQPSTVRVSVAQRSLMLSAEVATQVKQGKQAHAHSGTAWACTASR